MKTIYTKLCILCLAIVFFWPNSLSASCSNCSSSNAQTIFACDTGAGSETFDLNDVTVSASNVVHFFETCSGGDVSDSIATLSYSATPGTVIYARVSNSEGVCQDVLPITLSENNISIDITPSSLTICNDVTLNATPSGGSGSYTNFQWSGGSTATTEDITISSAGTYTIQVTDSDGCTATDQVVISANNLSISVTPSSFTLCGPGETVSLNATPSGGTGSYTDFQWSGGSNSSNEDITASSAGTYTIEVTDSDGCTATAQSVISSGSITASISNSTTVICSGENVSLTASGSGGSGNYSYQWSGGSSSTNATITPSSPGTYTVEVTDDNSNCTDTDQVTLTASNLSVNVDASEPVVCNPGSVSLSATASGGGGGYMYQWSGPSNSTNKDITVSSGGTYTMVVTDSDGCTATDNFLISVSSLSVSISPANPEFCAGQSVTLTAVVTGEDGTADVEWFNSNNQSQGTGFTLDVSSPGSYYATATDDFCEESSSLRSVTERPELDPQFSNTDFVICSDETIVLALTGSYSDYSWSTGSSSSTIPVSSGGTYSVTVEDANNCSGSTSISISELSTITVSVQNSSKLEVNCKNDNSGSINISVSGGSGSGRSFSWSGPGNFSSSSEDITGLSAGDYFLTVTDSEGCQFTGLIATVTEPQVLSLDLSPIDAQCFEATNGSISLTAQGGSQPYTYLWSNGATTKDLNNVGEGTYSVTVTDSKGCTATGSEFVDDPDLYEPVISASQLEICNGESTSLSVGSGISWSWDNNLANQQNVTVSPTSTTTYSVTATNTAGCLGEASITIVVNQLPTVNINQSANEICAEQSVTLTASGGVNYIWDDSRVQNGNSFFLDIPGNYDFEVTVTDANGCSSTGSTSVLVNANPSPDFENTSNSVVNFEQTIINVSDPECGDLVSCQWFVDGQPQNNGDCEDLKVTFPDAREYNITLNVTNSCGCTSEITDAIPIDVNQACIIKRFRLNDGTPTACIQNPVIMDFDIEPSEGCGLAEPTYSVRIIGGSNAVEGTHYTINRQDSTITFLIKGEFGIKQTISETGANCGCSKTSGERIINVLDPATVTMAASSNNITVCSGEQVNINFPGFQDGYEVEIDINGELRPTQLATYPFIENDPGTYVVRLISVNNGSCKNNLVSGELTINVVAELEITGDGLCDPSGVIKNFSYNVQGGDPAAPIELVSSIITKGCDGSGGPCWEVSGNNIMVNNLRVDQNYNFTIKKGNTCSSKAFQIRDQKCDCTIFLGQKTEEGNMGVAGCQGETISLDFKNLVNMSNTNFNPEIDSIVYILHDKAGGQTLGRPYKVYFGDNNFTVDIEYDEAYQTGINYYISMVSIKKSVISDPTFEVVFEEPETLTSRGPNDCFSIVNGIPLTWFSRPNPQIRFSMENGVVKDSICRNESGFVVTYNPANTSDGSTYRYNVVGLDESSIQDFGGGDQAVIHFNDLTKDSFEVQIIESVGQFDPESGETVICEGISSKWVYVKPNTMASNPSEIILWPGNILACTDTSGVCYRWGYYDIDNILIIDTTQTERFYYADTDVASTSRKYFVETYDCNNNSCATRTYFNYVGPPPGLNIEEGYSFSMAVYPNPTTGEYILEIESLGDQKLKLDIFDFSGKKIDGKSLDVYEGTNKVYENIQDYTSGLYILRMYDEKENIFITEKLIKL